MERSFPRFHNSLECKVLKKEERASTAVLRGRCSPRSIAWWRAWRAWWQLPDSPLRRRQCLRLFLVLPLLSTLHFLRKLRSPPLKHGVHLKYSAQALYVPMHPGEHFFSRSYFYFCSCCKRSTSPSSIKTPKHSSTSPPLAPPTRRSQTSTHSCSPETPRSTPPRSPTDRS